MIHTGSSRSTPRGSTLRRRLRLGGAVLVAAAGLSIGAPPFGSGHASCAGPIVTIEGASPIETPTPTPPIQGAYQVSPGQQLTVRGTNFYDESAGCDDTATGCSAPQTPPPAQDIPLRVVSGSQEWDLGAADAAGRDRAASWTARLPTDLPAGQAELRAGSAKVQLHVVEQ